MWIVVTLFKVGDIFRLPNPPIDFIPIIRDNFCNSGCPTSTSNYTNLHVAHFCKHTKLNKKGAHFLNAPLIQLIVNQISYFFSSNNFSLVTTVTKLPSFNVLLTVLYGPVMILSPTFTPDTSIKFKS